VARLDPEARERARRWLIRRDPVLGELVRRVGPCGLRPRGTLYQALVRSILYQQLAGSAAAAIHRRFREAFGGRDPTPAELLRASPARLRRAGLSRQKAEALRDVAEAFGSGRIRPRALQRRPDREIVEELVRLRGVGEWTAHMVLIFCLGRPDVLPVGDYGVRKGIRALYGLPALPRPAEMEALAEPWRPFRTVACWYLWRHLDVAPPA